MAAMKDIKESLIKQLKEKDADALHYKSLVDDYVFLWNQKNKMKTSIKKDGMTIKAVSSTGKKYDKDNPAIKMVLLYEKQMLQILDKLGISPNNTINPDGNTGNGEEDGDNDL